jgi:hypothetical protein
MGKIIKNALNYFPTLYIEVTSKPITRTVLKINLSKKFLIFKKKKKEIENDFDFNSKIHGDSEPWYIYFNKKKGIIFFIYYLKKKKKVDNSR